MGNLLDIMGQMDEIERYGMEIPLHLPSTDLVDFKISYRNEHACSTKDGATIQTGDLTPYTDHFLRQLTVEGYHLREAGGIWSQDCYYAYLDPEDAEEEYPQMKVYIHPNSLSGWAPEEDVGRLMEMADENPYISGLRLVYARRVCHMTDARYLDILKEAEPQIRAWLAEYARHNGAGDAGETFNRVFGVRRLAYKHLSYRDPVAINFVNGLGMKR